MEVQEGLSVSDASTAGGVPVAPGLRAVLETGAGPDGRAVDRRTAVVCGLAIVVAIGAGLAAQLLTALIGFLGGCAAAYFFSRLCSQRNPS